jgi:putative glycosyltransferase (TIGR04372 family)
MNSTLLYLTKSAVRLAVQVLFALTVVPVLFVIRPYRRIVVRKLAYNRIGHLAGNSDFELRLLQLYPAEPKRVDLFISGTPANRQIAEMLKRHLTIYEGELLIRLYFMVEPVLEKTPFYKADTWNEFDCLREIATTHATLRFSEAEEERGRQTLSDMGIEDGAWFVCVHSRDSHYLQATNPSGDWGYHDYRDCSIRNYLPAMREITRRGGYVLRMGSHVSEALGETGDPRIIDYACEHRSDFMDIYASAKCRFFLGSTAGLFNVAWVFDVPIAHANMTPLSVLPFRKADLFIPKLLRRIDGGGFLHLDEAYDLGLFDPERPNLFTSDFYRDMGLEFVESSDDEILALTREMFDKLEARSPEAAPRQKAFKAKYYTHIADADLVGDVSAYFLEKHRDVISVPVPDDGADPHKTTAVSHR